MSKDNTNKKWWERDIYGDLFSNTRKAHEKKYGKGYTVQIEDEEEDEEEAHRGQPGGYNGYDDDDYNSGYEDFGSRMSDAEGAPPEDDELMQEIDSKLKIIGQLSNSSPLDQKAIQDLKKKLYKEKKAKQKADEAAQGTKNSWWDDYEKTGRWKGYSYYRKPQLSYRYVQQMANLIASQHNINIKVGNTWASDLSTKTLMYNPTSLMYGTKGELLLTLLHEVGKLRLSSSMTELKSTWLDKYKERAYEATLIFEDLRVDLKMLKSYPSAPEVYESQGAVMKDYVEGYIARGNMVRDRLHEYLKHRYKDVQDRYTYEFQNWMSMNNKKLSAGIGGISLWGSSTSAYSSYSNQGPRYSPDDLAEFHRQVGKGILQRETKSRLGKAYDTVEELNDTMEKTLDEIKDMPTLEDYLAEMYILGYNVDTTQKVGVNVDKYVDVTKDYMQESPKMKTHQDIVVGMNTKVYPQIEDLLKNSDGKSDSMMENAPNIAQDFANNRDHFLDGNQMGMSTQEQQKGQSVGVRKGGQQNQRNRGDEQVPQDWADGDYTALKESVEAEIKTLVNRLTFLRREESVIKHEANQRRGKLDSKKLYKSRFGNTRIFKRKLESRDTIRSFAFSILVDTSGSMQGNRMIHTTRAMVLFAEVFEKMQIPYEIVTYRHDAVTVKGFDQAFDGKMKKKIGGLAKAADGGTELSAGLEQLELKKREEKNKIALVLTDGDVGDIEHFNQEYFEPWEKKLGIKSIGIGIETGDYMKELCNHNGIVLENAAEIPIQFTEILKGLIKRR